MPVPKGTTYPFQVFRNGVPTRSHFLDLSRAALGAVRRVLSDRRGTTYEVIELPSMRVRAFARRDKRTRVQLYWHTRRKIS